MTQRKWRRTALTGANGLPVPDDWSLVDERLGPVARIYRIRGGPRDGHWFWTVLVNAEGCPFNAGTGNAPTGADAKAAVEALMARLPRA